MHIQDVLYVRHEMARIFKMKYRGAGGAVEADSFTGGTAQGGLVLTRCTAAAPGRQSTKWARGTTTAFLQMSVIQN